MEAKAVDMRKPRGGKKEQAQVKNRRALKDIGNFMTFPTIEGKISRPITRGFRAQLLSNAQLAAEKNKLTIVDDCSRAVREGRVVKKAVEVRRKIIEKEIHDNVIEISSDEEENAKPGQSHTLSSQIPESENENVFMKISPAREGKVKPSGAGSSKEIVRNVKTLNSILSTRSKAAACGITYEPKDSIVNIDADDINDDLSGVEYVDDLYVFYKATENESLVHDYMLRQPNINGKMRGILVDWLIEVHCRFQLMPETLYLTINVLDRYLSKKTASVRELQLVGIGSMLIACKYEEIYAPLVSDFVTITDNAYSCKDILIMEKAILGELVWYLTVPTPYVFLARYIKACVSPNQKMVNMAFFLAELGLVNYTTMLHYPSMLAASAVYAARCTLNMSPFWTETLKHHTGYCEEQLVGCARLLVRNHSELASSENKIGVYKKFTNPNRNGVALFTPAKCLLKIAAP